jgi:hypothetical protein
MDTMVALPERLQVGLLVFAFLFAGVCALAAWMEPRWRAPRRWKQPPLVKREPDWWKKVR